MWRPAEAQDVAEVAAHALVRAEVEQAALHRGHGTWGSGIDPVKLRKNMRVSINGDTLW